MTGDAPPLPRAGTGTGTGSVALGATRSRGPCCPQELSWSLLAAGHGSRAAPQTPVSLRPAGLSGPGLCLEQKMAVEGW